MARHPGRSGDCRRDECGEKVGRAALAGAAGDTNPSSPAHLHAAMALLPVDRSLEPTVLEGLLSASPQEIAAILDSLAKAGDRDELSKSLWKRLENAQKPVERRFRAGVAVWPGLTRHPLKDRRAAGSGWPALCPINSSSNWPPIRRPSTLDELLAPCTRRCIRNFDKSSSIPIVRRSTGTWRRRCWKFCAQQPRELVDLLLDAEPDQYAILLPKLHRLGEPAEQALLAEFNAPIPKGGTAEARRTPVRRHAHAAVALSGIRIDRALRLATLRQPVTPTCARTPRIAQAGRGPTRFIFAFDDDGQQTA